MCKIEVSQTFFISILLEKLKSINSHVTKIDEITYSKDSVTNDEILEIWRSSRESGLLLEQIIESLE